MPSYSSLEEYKSKYYPKRRKKEIEKEEEISESSAFSGHSHGSKLTKDARNSILDEIRKTQA